MQTSAAGRRGNTSGRVKTDAMWGAKKAKGGTSGWLPTDADFLGFFTRRLDFDERRNAEVPGVPTVPLSSGFLGLPAYGAVVLGFSLRLPVGGAVR